MKLIILLLTTIGISSAQEILKHPRVAELEDTLQSSASQYIKARFPDIPFMVTVRVDPLRRDARSRMAYDADAYFEPDPEEEIKDEWDNSQVPLKALINRAKRITVTLSVPSKLREGEVNELREGIFNLLHLTQARDEVQVARRDWITQEVPWLAIYVASATLLALLVGLLLINRSSANRIARALTELKLGQSSSSNAQNTAMPQQTVSETREDARKQELTFNDPIKMKELASRHIQFLVSAPTFPNHRDVFLLDKLGQEKPEKLGAILAEFPAEMQSQLFAYSTGFHWIEALNDPGFLDFECLEIIQAMTQVPRKGDDLEWDHAVLSVWRLDDERTSFIKVLNKDEAFALLAAMPKAVGVHEARKAFPGSWAALLEPSFEAKAISTSRSKEILEAATRILPLNTMTLVEKYKTERELLEYLRTVDHNEERDIYGALPETSLVHRLRPPFYPIFDQSPDSLRWIVPTVSQDQWALALFNLPKSERAKVDSHFSDKQRFLLIERFKKFDQAPPEPKKVSEARAAVGRALKMFLASQSTANTANQDANSVEVNISDEPKAA